MTEQETQENDLAAREKLVDTAVKFLKNPKVASSPLKTKQEFLRRKGLSEDEIKKACELAATFINDRSAVSPVANEFTSIPMPPSHLYPYYNQQVFRPTIYTKLKEFFNATAIIGASFYCVYWFYKKFIEPFLFGSKKTDSVEDSVAELDKSVQSSMAEVKESIATIASSVKQLSQNQTADAANSSLLQELKQDLASLKGLLLSRKQFPSAPPSIPAWQLDTSSQTHQEKSAEHEDDAGSGSSTNNSDSSLEMIREDPPKE